MTRVNKGGTAKSGPPYLVCSKAKSGLGCEYKSVKLDNVEAAIRQSYADIAESLSAYGSEGIAADLATLETTEIGLTDQIDELVSALADAGRSPALTKRLRALETHLEAVQKEVAAKRSLLGTKSLAARLRDLKGAVGGTVSGLNTALRELFASVVVEYKTGELDMRAHSGAVCRVMYEWRD